ncbi:MAG: hypothetical protein ACKOUR_03160 [Planctomycetota bacterium]
MSSARMEMSGSVVAAGNANGNGLTLPPSSASIPQSHPSQSHPSQSQHQIAPPLFAQLGVPLLVLLACWLLLVLRHLSNDGLWFQGDAPRHLLNGIFWTDLVADGWRDPVDYAQRYYARYPAITPSRYPPVFHWLEAALFSVVPFSAAAGKGLVLASSLVGASYLLYALRRWVAVQAGLLAGLLLWMPAMISWSHAVMTNIPAVTFALAGLVHLRCALDPCELRTGRRQLGLALILLTLAVLTHPTIAYVGLIAAAWFLLTPRWDYLRSWRFMLVPIGCLLSLIVTFYILRRLSPDQFAQARLHQVAQGRNLLFYIRLFPTMIGPWLVALVALGLVLQVSLAQVRRDGVRGVVAGLIAYAVVTPIWAKDERYLLLACPWAVGFMAFAVVQLQQFAARLGGQRIANCLFLTLCLSVAGYLGVMLQRHPVVSVNCLELVEREAAKLAPTGPVLYDGRYDGVFTYQVRRRDVKFERHMNSARRWVEFSGQQTVEQITRSLVDSGCRYLVVEQPLRPNRRDSWEELMRHVQRGPELQLVKSIVDLPQPLPSFHIYRLAPQTDSPSAPAPDLAIPLFDRRVAPLPRRSN